LVGPNGSGKSTVLDVLQFLGDSVRGQLAGAVSERNGYDEVVFRGNTVKKKSTIRLGFKGLVTKHASERAFDEYELEFRSMGVLSRRRTQSPRRREFFMRREVFQFKRYRGPGRRISIQGSEIEVFDGSEKVKVEEKFLNKQSLGIATLPQLRFGDGGEQIGQMAELLTSFRVFDVDVNKARLPSHVFANGPVGLAPDASNLAEFLFILAQDSDRFEDLLRDARRIIPGFHTLTFDETETVPKYVSASIKEKWLEGTTSMYAASFGTVRALALLALLYDPSPPKLTCIEELDQGLHPHVFDGLVDLLRKASRRTQFLITTHSPALVNRLKPRELIVCERDEDTGAALIPAVNPEFVAETARQTELGIGELWFSGLLGGGL
jgi:predicted ATPase